MAGIRKVQMSRKEDEHQCHRRGEACDVISILPW